MTRFYTFERFTKISLASHDHCTLRFGVRSIMRRTVDRVKSVSTEWEMVGTFGTTAYGTPWIRFTKRDGILDLVAAQMERMGYRILSEFVPSKLVLKVQKSNGNVTNPDTIRFKEDQMRPIGTRLGVKPVRKRSIHAKRGARFGMRATTDVAAMRHAIVEAQTERCIQANLDEHGNYNGNCSGKCRH